MEEINIRRSVRRFKDQEVETEKIDLLLRAAMQAPSSGNQQPWEFIVITDNKTKKQISEMSQYASFAKDASLIIVVVASSSNMKYPSYAPQDLGACTQNILLEAVNLGLGTVWLGAYPMEERQTLLNNALNLKETDYPYSVILVGYPQEHDANYYLDRFDKNRVHYNKYSSD